LSLPFFYISDLHPSQQAIALDEETSKHVVQVLRMKIGESLNLTDGKGNLLTASIEDDHKKHCTVTINERQFIPEISKKISVGISLIKNAGRFEWFLEKATEIGLYEIIPLICDRTEKQKFRTDRMKSILISAMLQSRQSRLPLLQEPVSVKKIIENAQYQQKFIAHCIEEEKRKLSDLVNESTNSQIILIGPEGDFTEKEIELAMQNNFVAVTLGDTRLRTETAGIAAAVILKLS
jgi:16S rRNA (uracil1498-N3)-methyltransferase